MPLKPEVVSTIQQLKRVMEAWFPDFQEDLAWLVAHDRGATYKAGVDTAAEWMLAKLRALGCITEVYPSDDCGSTIAGTLKGRGQGRFLIMAHLDTVWPEGTAAEWPLRIEGNRAMGPGVVDNGSGSLTGYYILKALQALGYDNFEEVTLVLNGDEETGSLFSNKIIEQLSRGRDAAFCLEAPDHPDEIVSERAGSMVYDLRVTGKKAHSGTSPEAGANAILELAHKLVACHQISGEDEVLAINAVTAEGGPQSGIIPDYARAELDVRMKTLAEIEWLDARFHEIAERIWVLGTSATITGKVYHVPMERVPGTAYLVELAQAIGRELDLELKERFCGGVSDACFATVVGTPTLCGLAPFGQLYHTRDEYLDLSTVVPRATLVAGLVVACAEAGSRK
jgi:glutamate carboxypeptidase